MDNYQEEQKITYTKCNHLFHKKCIETWRISAASLTELDYRQGKNNFVATCPTCRNKLTQDMLETSIRQVRLISPTKIISYQLNMLIKKLSPLSTFIDEYTAVNSKDPEDFCNKSTYINILKLNHTILNIIGQHKNYSVHSLYLVDKILHLVDRIDHTRPLYIKLHEELSKLSDQIASHIIDNIEYIEIFLKYTFLTEQAITIIINHYIFEKKFAKAEELIKNNNVSNCIEINTLKDELLANININNQTNVKSILSLINSINHKTEKYKNIQLMLRFVLNLIAEDGSYNIEFIDIFLEYKIITKKALTAVMRFSIHDMDLYKSLHLQEVYNIDLDFIMLELVMLENIKNDNKYNILQILHIICNINRENVEHQKIQQMLDNIINKIILDHKKLNTVHLLQKHLQIFKDYSAKKH
jgi:hypothetical protein